MKNSINRAIVRIVLTYALFAGLWILLSDELLGLLLPDAGALTYWSMIKGLAFVIVTALLLSGLLRAELRKREQARLALKESEEQIRRSQALLQAVTEGTPDAVFVKDLEGRYLMLNSGTARIVGKSREEILGKDDTAIFPPEDARMLMEGDRQIMEAGTTQTREESLVIAGERRAFLATKGPVRDPQNQVIGLFGISHDITERKRHEKEVERLKRLYAALSQTNQSIVRVRSQDELFVKICRALVEFGQCKVAWIGMLDRETMAVKPVAQWGDDTGYLQSIRIYADDRPEGNGPTGRCIREARPYRCNDYLADPNTLPWREAAEKQGWASAFSAPIRAGDKVWGALTVYATEKAFFGEKEAMLLEEVAVDISFALQNFDREHQRRQAEEALRISEEKWHTIINTSPDGIAMISLDGIVLFASGKSLAMHGYQHLDEVVGRHMFEFLNPAYHGKAAAHLQAIMRGEKTGPEEYQLLRKDGTRFFSEINIEALRDKAGVPTSVFFIERDITARKLAQEANQSLATAVEQSVEAIVITDTQGKILYVNRGFEKVSGYSRQEVLGQNPRLLKSGKQPDEHYRQLWTTISRGEVWRGRLTNRRKDGSLFEEEATISPIRDDQGQIIRYVAVKRDVTRELMLERQIIEAQKMEAVGQLAGGVAHDYNNILAASMMQLGMMLSEPGLTPDLQEGLQALKKGTDRAANLTRQLLMFGRRQAMQKKPVEMNALLDDELKMLRRLLGEHIELTVQTRNGDAWIEADPGMIEQVIMNLCINARDAMPKGGKLILGVKTVAVDARAPAASIEARPGQFVCLTVLDVGCGMNAETIDRIFEPFFTTKEVGKGTGLGLATVYGIVKQHNGWIEVNSELGKGSEFRIFLPVSSAHLPGAAATTAPQIIRGTETVLVVEDEAALRKSVVMCLKFAGYRIFEAANGPDALEQWREKTDQIDLLLTDMIMPGGMSGLELADAFTKLKPTMPVIVTSGYSTEMLQSGVPSRPGFTYLPKPCDTSALTAAVRQSLDQLRLDRS